MLRRTESPQALPSLVPRTTRGTTAIAGLRLGYVLFHEHGPLPAIDMAP